MFRNNRSLEFSCALLFCCPAGRGSFACKGNITGLTSICADLVCADQIIITWPAWCVLPTLGQLCSTEGGTACSVPRCAREAVHDCLCLVVQEYREHIITAIVDTSAKQGLLLLSTDQRRRCFERVTTGTEWRIQCCYEILRICRGRAQPIYDLNATSSCVQYAHMLVRSQLVVNGQTGV